MPSEFDIIRQFFSHKPLREDVVVGVGDDAAVLELPRDKQLVQCVDTLVAGVHFPFETSAADIAYKALAVNLSDLAAMGAEPAWFTLALTVPAADPEWLSEFSHSMAKTASNYGIELVGGDTTQGPLTISINVSGFVEPGKALTRGGAQPGDAIYVSGSLGDAAVALAEFNGSLLIPDQYRDYFFQRLNRPVPRLLLGQQLADIASACIDISDGLVADLGHILEQSQVGASIHTANLPRSEQFTHTLQAESLALPLLLSQGDDYELCFTVAQKNFAQLETLLQQTRLKVTCIGQIETMPGLRCMDAQGEIIEVGEGGYQHFGIDE